MKVAKLNMAPSWQVFCYAWEQNVHSYNESDVIQPSVVNITYLTETWKTFCIVHYIFISASERFFFLLVHSCRWCCRIFLSCTHLKYTMIQFFFTSLPYQKAFECCSCSKHFKRLSRSFLFHEILLSVHVPSDFPFSNLIK